MKDIIYENSYYVFYIDHFGKYMRYDKPSGRHMPLTDSDVRHMYANVQEKLDNDYHNSLVL